MTLEPSATAVHVALAETDDELRACWAVMAELRPHLEEAGFVALCRRLEALSGLRIVFLADGGVVQAVAGIRIGEWLASGRYLEIEDLVTRHGARGEGHGGRLFDWIVAYARGQACRHVRLVSHVSRVDAHRFYERNGMERMAWYFSQALDRAEGDAPVTNPVEDLVTKRVMGD